MTSPFDIIARLERSPAAWVCIRREAADEIRKLRAERDAISAKLAIAVEAMERIANDQTFLRADKCVDTRAVARNALAKIKENSK